MIWRIEFQLRGIKLKLEGIEFQLRGIKLELESIELKLRGIELELEGIELGLQCITGTNQRNIPFKTKKRQQILKFRCRLV